MDQVGGGQSQQLALTDAHTEHAGTLQSAEEPGSKGIQMSELQRRKQASSLRGGAMLHKIISLNQRNTN